MRLHSTAIVIFAIRQGLSRSDMSLSGHDMSFSSPAGALSRGARSLSSGDHPRSRRVHGFSACTRSFSSVSEYGRPGRGDPRVGPVMAGGGCRWMEQVGRGGERLGRAEGDLLPGPRRAGTRGRGARGWDRGARGRRGGGQRSASGIGGGSRRDDLGNSMVFASSRRRPRSWYRPGRRLRLPGSRTSTGGGRGPQRCRING
jgi:hypothetical protein